MIDPPLKSAIIGLLTEYLNKKRLDQAKREAEEGVESAGSS